MPIISVQGIQLSFPFEPYPCQVTYMEKVIECLKNNVHGVLESPTGTGKTLCLLCSSLAWLETKKAQSEFQKQVDVSSLMGDKTNFGSGNLDNLAKSLEQSTGTTWGGSGYVVPKIIYASRTHSQLSQAVQEMKRTAYNSMKVSVIGSREQLCIHEQVKKETSNTSKVHLCRAKVAARTCHYYNHFDEMKRNGDPRQMVGAVVDIEDMVAYGEKNRVCPYYMARELKTDADITFMPYNYLLDPKSRRAHGVELQGNIIIFDEAHNLEKICEDSSSFDLTSGDIATAMEEVTRLSEKLLQQAQEESQSNVEFGDSTPEPEFNLDDLLRIKSTLKELEDAVDNIELPTGGKGLTKPGIYIFELLSTVNIGFETKGMILDQLEKVISYITSDTTSSAFHTKGIGLTKFSDVLKIVFSQDVRDGLSLSAHKEQIARCYKVHIIKEEPKKKKKMDLWTNSAASEKTGRILSYWCFSPGHSMRDLLEHGVKSIILTSGTLSPLESFTMEMQIPFLVSLENPHVIEKHQVWIGTLGKGPDGITLNSNFETRFNIDYQSSLGNAIVNFARVVPNGLLIFFPSYTVMDKCLELWQQNNIWNRITQYKPVFVEPKGKTAFLETMDDFYQKINNPSLNGAIFIAVCRGKVSEGLDFSDINGRAVVITGLPFPPRMDPKVVLKMQFLDEMKGKHGFKSLSGREWYRQQASRAVNQAIGRVIRHRHDYGAIILCDTRFNSPDSLNQLPVWVRPHVNKCSQFGQAMRDVMGFFKTAEKLMPAPAAEKKKRQSERQPGCTGAYFMPTLTRSSAIPEKARMVAQHVPSLKTQTNQGQSDLILQSQYEGQSSQGQVKKQGLLNALDFSEKTTEEKFETDHWRTGQMGEEMKERKINVKKKIIIRKRDSEDPKDDSSKVVSVSGSNLSFAENYIAEVKRILGKESYKLFSKALHDYKKTEDYSAVTSIMADLFVNDPSNFQLFRKFYKFARPKHKQQFHELCKDLTGEGCGYKPEDTVNKKRLLSGSSTVPPEKKIKRTEENVCDSNLEPLKSNSIEKCSWSVSQPTDNDKCTLDKFLQPSQNGNTKINKSELIENGKNIFPPKSRALTELETVPSGSKMLGSKGDNLKEKKACLLPANESTDDLFGEEETKSSGIAEVEVKQELNYPPPQSKGYSCCKCQKDARTPFRSLCDHICCFQCWRQVFDSDKLCPECRQRVRRRHLRQLCFQSGPNLDT